MSVLSVRRLPYFFFVKCELLVNWREKVREFEDARKKVRREEREAPVYKQHTYVTRTMGGNIPKIRSQLKKVSIIFSRIHF